MKLLHLWRGYHGAEFASLFERCWDARELLIACPPTPLDLSFVAALPRGRIVVHGSWSAEERAVLAQPVSSVTMLPDSPVLGVFTTGTTRSGQKLVLFSERNVLSSQDAIWTLFEPHRVRQVYCYPQPYHVFGLLLGYALARHRGLKLLTPSGPYDRSSHASWLASAAGSGGHLLTLATPSHMLDLCSYLRESRVDVPSTDTCILGGARVDRSVWDAAQTVAKIAHPSIGYGCTEASPGITHLPPGVRPLADGDIGWPLADVTLASCAEGGFTMTGPSVCLAMIEDGVVTCPDKLTVRDHLSPSADGRCVFTGRLDGILNRGGEKFGLEQIESHLKERHGLDAICVAMPHPRLGSELGILARAKTTVTRGDIMASLQARYLRAFSSAAVRFVDELPLDASAKPDRRQASHLLEGHA